MRYESFIAIRYLLAKRRTGFISIISLIALVGIAFGVAVLEMVQSGFNGFEKEVRSSLINADAHIRIRKYHDHGIENYDSLAAQVRTVPGVVGASPVIRKESVLWFRGNNQPVAVRAFDPLTAGHVSKVPESIWSGKFDLGKVDFENKELPGIVLGRYLAEGLYIFDEGEKIVLWSLPRQAGLFAQPKAQEFVVTGISEIGFYEYDKIFAYISIEEAQKLFKMPQAVTRIDVKVENFEMAQDLAPLVEKKLGGYPFHVSTWFDQNRSLYSWMEYEKLLFSLVLGLIVIVAAINIISSLVMIVMEKTREIGILKSMGASSRGILRIFLLEGIIIGGFGTILGNILSYTICLAQLKFGFIRLPPEVYIIDKLPLEMHLNDFLAVSVVAIVLSILASAYPAYKASKLHPVESIRYE